MGFAKQHWSFLVAGAMASLSAIAQNTFEAAPFVSGTGLHCIHGLTFDKDDRLYVGSVIGQSVYRVDTQTGAHEIAAGPPEGLADDMEFGPDGALYFTSIIQGALRKLKPDGKVETVAQGKPGFNSIAFNAEGRLFSAEVFLGDALYEIDPAGKKPPRTILQNQGGLNGFDFGPDGKLYGPLWFKGQVVRVDVDSGVLEVVADGFGVPAAANFNSKGDLYVLDSQRGHIVKVDHKTGAKTTAFELKTAMDNLAFDSQDRLFVTVMSESAIYEIDLAKKEARKVREDPLGVPADMAVWRDDSGETIYLADTFALRAINAHTGAVKDVARFVATHLQYPTGIDVTEEHIHTVSFNGSVAQTWRRDTGELLATHEGLAGVMDVVALPDGGILTSLLVGGKLDEIAMDGTRTTIATGLTTPTCMVLDRKGGVYVTEYMPGNVVRIDLNNGERRVVCEGLDKPEGITIVFDGQLLVAETGTQSVVLIDPTNGNRDVLATDVPMGLNLTPQLPPMGVPTGIAAATDGSVFVSADLTDSIWKLSRGE